MRWPHAGRDGHTAVSDTHLCMTASNGEAACPRSGAAGPLHSPPALRPLRAAAAVPLLMAVVTVVAVVVTEGALRTTAAAPPSARDAAVLANIVLVWAVIRSLRYATRLWRSSRAP